MRKKVIGMVLMLILSCSLVTGCGTRKPEVTLNIKVPVFQIDTPEGLKEAKDIYTFVSMAAEAFAEQYEQADVTINVTQYESARRQSEIDDCFDTEKAADVLWASTDTYIFTGRVVPLDDIISEKIRADIDEKYWENCCLDGKTYKIPFFTSQVVLCYNKELFRQAGLDAYISEKDEIQNWTLEEWDEILETLSKKLPDTVYPMMMYAGSSDGDALMMTLLCSRGGTLYDKNGMLCFSTPEVLKAMSWIREGCSRGYFPPGAENLIMLDCYELFMNDQLAIYCANIALQTLYAETDMDYGLVNLPSSDGNGYSSASILGFMVMDNGDEDKLKAAKAFVQYVYETEWMDYSAGGITVSSRVAEKYDNQMQNAAMYIENAKNGIDCSANKPNWDGVRKVFYLHMKDLLYGEKPVEQVAAELEEDCNAAMEEGLKNGILHE